MENSSLAVFADTSQPEVRCEEFVLEASRILRMVNKVRQF